MSAGLGASPERGGGAGDLGHGLSQGESRVCAAIERRASELLADLTAHVAIPTGTGHAVGIDEYRGRLVARLERLGASAVHVPGDPRPEWLTLPNARGGASGTAPSTVVVTRVSAAAAPPSILIAGHVDTVHDPAGAFQSLSVSADRVTAVGPGAADMKGGILVAIAALEALAEAGIDLPWTFILNADEETGSFHSASALTAAARRHRIGLALEPALPDGSLVVERMGTGQFHVEVRGRAAHVGRDFDKGVSAVYELARLIGRMQALIDLPGGAIVNVGPLTGGQVTNAVPDRAACWGNVRFADEVVQRRLTEAFKAFATADDVLPRVLVDTAFNRPAKPLTPAVDALARAARDAAGALGQQLPFARTGGVCDGNILQAAGLPTIDTLGVRGGNLHRTDEFIEVRSLVERTQLFAVLLGRLAG